MLKFQQFKDTQNSVAKYLVPNIRSVATMESKKPTYIRFLTGLKAYSQIFSVKKNHTSDLLCSHFILQLRLC
ncbi:Chlorophyll(ide) b reductase NOL, chloroplastic [Apostasia shenzhenica]|uniref:Chlorophyll(Ide) b reductase NOL, chloroplastic n=1 Tax=Apostasia shenzhenica TaxID=1088818 RepID=A0A2I0AW51_9ASPA|nr:Chlorophyll(ide) b reductase NOL, chloroplastic [Apostasia shenzhenica]